LPLLGALSVAAAAGAASGAPSCVGSLEFGKRFGVKGARSLLEVLSAMENPVSEALAVGAATMVALGERVGIGAVWRVAEPAVVAGPAPESAAVELTGLGPTGATAELNDADSTGVEFLTWAALALGTAVRCAFGDSVTCAGLLLTEDCGAGIGVANVVVIDIGIGDGVVAGAEDAGATLVAESLGADASAGGVGIKGAAATDGDSTIGDWPRAKRSREKTGVPVGTGAWNRLSAGVGTGETGTGGAGESDCVCVGKAGASETETDAVEDGAGAAEGCVERLEDECALPEAAGPMADGSSKDLGPGPVESSVGTVEFAGALAALESSGGATAGISRLPAVGDTAEIAVSAG
jgi:hypothetical protein